MWVFYSSIIKTILPSLATQYAFHYVFKLKLVWRFGYLEEECV